MNTQESKAAARAAGMKLLRRMKGKGWRLRVHENIGWHYSVYRGPLQLFPSGPRHFFCLLSGNPTDRPAMGGDGIWIDRGVYTDPNKAVDGQIRLARAVIARLTRAVDYAAMSRIPARAIVKKRRNRLPRWPTCVAGCGYPVSHKGDACGECACEDDCAP